jgi:hypothetical protein
MHQLCGPLSFAYHAICAFHTLYYYSSTPFYDIHVLNRSLLRHHHTRDHLQILDAQYRVTLLRFTKKNKTKGVSKSDASQGVT